MKDLVFYQSDRTPRENWTYYFLLYLTSLSYSFAVTSFTDDTFKNIQKTVMSYILTKYSYCRTYLGQ